MHQFACKINYLHYIIIIIIYYNNSNIICLFYQSKKVKIKISEKIKFR
ncbi:hypothetical protein DDB_G0283491 [Dictyostelium discoideum AX4]|nr:hypothetical protein DDB_G0283491 [Dictyostelium discoideum AX4]EAL65730.1 hypothetical protein DDB_G0283491 [Dictyostelium discoideum AX4]|eukprot:XP_639089.1 hypothetical protein DDB_G0283491 [Dictyostelium discoideum AX4]